MVRSGIFAIVILFLWFFMGSAYAQNTQLLTNGGFEVKNTDNEPQNWFVSGRQYTLDTAVAYSGTTSLKFTAPTSGSSYIFYNGSLSLSPNTDYILSAYVKTTNVTGSGEGVQLRVVEQIPGDTNISYSTTITGTTNWVHVTLPFTTSANFTSVRLDILYTLTQGSGEAWVDEISLTPANTQVLVGDANGDGAVNNTDYAIWKQEYTGALLSTAADFDKSGTVNILDYMLWLSNASSGLGNAICWQPASTPTPPPSPTASQPTPTSLPLPTPTPPLGSGSLSFTRVVIDPVSPKEAWMKSVGDISGDGQADLLISGDADSLVWYEYPSWVKREIDGFARSQSGSVIADLDGDGDQDVIVGVNWYENLGQGRSWTKRTLGSFGTHDIEVADMNKDGKMDVIMRGETDSPVRIFLQNTKTSWSSIDIDPGRGRNGLAIGDIDRDSWLDVAVGGVWMKNPGATLATAPWSAYVFTDWYPYATVVLKDMNTDGRLDAIMAPSEQAGDIALFTQPANPTASWSRTTIYANVESVHSLDVVDMDADGRLDVVGSEFRGSKRLAVYLNTSSGWQQRVLGTEGLHQTRVVDIGNDGDLDIFGHVCPEPEACFGTGEVVIMENKPTSQNKILVFSRTISFRHDSIGAGINAIRTLGAQNGFTVDTTEDPTAFTAANLANYKAIVFLNTQGDILNSTQKTAFQNYIQNGGGFVGIHSAADTMVNWAWYKGLVGGVFSTEIRATQLKVTKVANHISTQSLPDPWYIDNEAYNFDVNPKTNGATVLLNLDESYVNGGTMGTDHPISWYHTYSGGRAWYTNLGSDASVYTNTQFLSHILGGIRWAAQL